MISTYERRFKASEHHLQEFQEFSFEFDNRFSQSSTFSLRTLSKCQAEVESKNNQFQNLFKEAKESHF